MTLLDILFLQVLSSSETVKQVSSVAMAIRVLVLNVKRILAYPDLKVRCFAGNPKFPVKEAPEFGERFQYRQLVSLANLLQRYGFPSSGINDYLQKNRFLMKFSLVDVEKSLSILLSFRLPQNSIVSILSACPGVLELGFLKKWEKGFSDLRLSTVSPLLVKSVLEHCRKFEMEPIDLHRSLQVLKGVEFGERTICRVLEEFPRTIRMKPNDICRKIEYFKSFGFQFDEIDRIFYHFPGVLGFSIEDRLRPQFREFEDLGFTVNEIRREVIRNPKVLGMEIGELSLFLDIVKSLKCREVIKEKIVSMGAFGAGIQVKLRVDCLCRHGLIRRDALKVVQREPRSIIYEIEDIEKKLEFLTHKMGFKIGCLIEVPEYLGVNFDKQIVPRYNVIEYLRSIGGLGMEVGLKCLIKPSRLRFYNLYVKPYPECEQMFGRFSRVREVKTQHPPGLWKLFKPPGYPQSKEDLENMKLVMDSVA